MRSRIESLGVSMPGGLFKLGSVDHAVAAGKRCLETSRYRPAEIQTLINAGVVKGRRLTSFASIREDLKSAGAKWEDAEVVVDDGLVTSRPPGDRCGSTAAAKLRLPRRLMSTTKSKSSPDFAHAMPATSPAAITSRYGTPASFLKPSSRFLASQSLSNSTK